MSCARRMGIVLSSFVAASAVLAVARAAWACGCFAPPDPTVPVLQAGERIVFAISGNQVTAHIQIQYVGDAKEFGWLLPLPSIPTLELGTDELFSAVGNRTAPQYIGQFNTTGQCWSFGGGADAAFGGASDLGVAGPPSPLVVQDSIGPFDYAVLKADDKQRMLDWLDTNRYFVPTGTQDAIGPYIRPGSYFLALKLKSGQSAGDIQPVVVRYTSDLPMIPIILTSVAAQPKMGVLAYLLGDARAIPRNYYHAVVNDAAINWVQGGSNYQDVVRRAVDEAPRKHAFVTEYAGPSSIMKNALDPPGRFGNLADLRQKTDAYDYLRYLRNNGYPFTSALIAILQKAMPLPQQVVNSGIKPGQFYFNADFYRQSQPWLVMGWAPTYDPVALTDEVELRVVKPTRDAAALFSSYPYLTRLYTRISPEDMTRDPVFSFNPFLPDVSNRHVATGERRCDNGAVTSVQVNTERGYRLSYPSGQIPAVAGQLPGAERIEILRESGSPEVVVDNRKAIGAALGTSVGPMGVDEPGVSTGACAVTPSPGSGRGGLVAALGLALAGFAVALRRRRR